MSLLVSVNEVIQSMGLDQNLEPDMDPAISKAILAAQSRLETELGTSLGRFSRSDTFKLDSDLFAGVTPNGLMLARLRQAFVASISSVQVSNAWNTGYEDLPTSLYAVHAEHGLLIVDPSQDHKYLRVNYLAGFLGANDCPESVKQALKYFVPLALKITSQDDPEKKKTADQVGAVAQGLIMALRRPTGFQFQPVFYSQAPSQS